ncbi:MAG: tryptophan--tRNA ligase [Holosporales bacterium]|jgi:tryptophanyl-tRNA synthetase|nr:tryptophan--tRNA ligase [Holosporales bacterium]
MGPPKKRIAFTADRPTGCLHLGHYIGSLLSRIDLQAQYESFVMIADTQALTDNAGDPGKVIRNVHEVCKDYLAIGIDPAKTTIFVQSCVPELFELTSYYMNLITVARLERNPTVKAEIQQKGFSESVPAGFLCYPVSQTADITAFKAELIPVGEDQLPLIEITNEIVRRFNRTYNTEVLLEATAVLSSVQRLVGIDGKEKAGKSLNNAVFLSDSEETIREKIFSMYTDPDHIKVSDPGKIEGNVVFTYLDAFHKDKEELESLKSQYQRGGLGDTVLKDLLNGTLQNLLRPIREKRASISVKDIDDILWAGSEKAQKIACETLREVRNAIGINYTHAIR